MYSRYLLRLACKPTSMGHAFSYKHIISQHLSATSALCGSVESVQKASWLLYQGQTAVRRLYLLLTRRVDSFAPFLHHLHQGSHDARGRSRSGRGRVRGVRHLREESHDQHISPHPLFGSPVDPYISACQRPVHFTVNKVGCRHNMLDHKINTKCYGTAKCQTEYSLLVWC